MSHTTLQPKTIVLLLSAFISIAIAPVAARAQARHMNTDEPGPQFTLSPFLGVRLGGRHLTLTSCSPGSTATLT